MPFSARVYEQNGGGADLPRERTRLTGSIGGADPYHIIVHNLSSEGLLVESYYKLEEGGEVVFDIEGFGRHAATVTWNDGSFYDCKFLTPVPASLIRAKLTNRTVIPFGRSAHPIPAPTIREIPEFADAPARKGLSSRMRVAAIVGGATLCWTPIVGIVALVMWLHG